MSETPEAKAEAKKQEAKATTGNKSKKNPDFVDMVNPKGITVEIHKDRVNELKNQAYTLVK